MDDFVISQFTQGPATMFPTWVFGSTRVGIPPHVFAFATIIFLTGATLAHWRWRSRNAAGPDFAAGPRARDVASAPGVREMFHKLGTGDGKRAIYLRKWDP